MPSAARMTVKMWRMVALRSRRSTLLPMKDPAKTPMAVVAAKNGYM